MTALDLINCAKKAAENAYSPYSHFKVGAALLCKDGTLYTGCNIENASFGVTCCAERVALFKAVSEKNTGFCEIAIVGGKDGDYTHPCTPCGICRQALSEFCTPDLKVHLCDGENTKTLTLAELLPHSFSL
ncbi:MAG: cytidine deaminase [Clostridia bacterium]|nr:cytidine deaminase [Clostridia bacterium]